MKGYLTGTLLFLAAIPAQALVGGSIDPNTADSPWAGVGAVINNGAVVSGALIDDWHVLTAAHVVGGASPGALTFRLNAGSEQTFAASAISVFPGYTGTTPVPPFGLWHDDLAIITLSAPVAGTVPVYDLYGGSLSNQTLTLVGYGGGGDGVNGVTSNASAGVKRVGQNKVDVLVPDDDGGPANELFMFDFDGPNADTNMFGNPTADNLTLGATIEAQYASGDSGSPAFVNDNGVWKIAGIATFALATSAEPGAASLFGAIGGGTVVAPYADWIASVTAAPIPEPETWLMLLAGFGLVLLRALNSARRTCTRPAL